MIPFLIYFKDNQEIILKDEWISNDNHIKQMEMLLSIMNKHMNIGKDKKGKKTIRLDRIEDDKKIVERLQATINYYKNLDNEINTNV